MLCKIMAVICAKSKNSDFYYIYSGLSHFFFILDSEIKENSITQIY